MKNTGTANLKWLITTLSLRFWRFVIGLMLTSYVLVTLVKTHFKEMQRAWRKQHLLTSVLDQRWTYSQGRPDSPKAHHLKMNKLDFQHSLLEATLKAQHISWSFIICFPADLYEQRQSQFSVFPLTVFCVCSLSWF